MQTSVPQGFLAAQATLFHVLMPIETSRNVNLYNASPLRFATFVHDLMNLQAPEGRSVSQTPRFQSLTLKTALSGSGTKCGVLRGLWNSVLQ